MLHPQLESRKLLSPMKSSLQSYAHGRDNNFNLLRFLAASVVLFTHSFALALGSGDAEPLKKTLGMTMGGMAVDLFFVSSGFLIAASFFSGKGLICFTTSRVLRIYPALLVAIFLTVFGLGPLFTELSPAAYLLDEQTYRYLLKNSLLVWGVEFNLPGVFLETPYPEAVNGSLWTLPYEVKMYGYLAMAGLCLTLVPACLFPQQLSRLAFLGLALLGLGAHFTQHFHPFHDPLLLHLFAMFFMGAAFYAWRDRIHLTAFAFAAILVSVVAAAFIQRDLFFIVYSAGLPYLVLYLAYVPGGFIRGFNRYGDYSYGLYIYAFPVQQVIADLVPGVGVAAMVALSFAITFGLAFLSWHLVEKRCLALKTCHVTISRYLDRVMATFLPRSVRNWIHQALKPSSATPLV